MRRSQLFVLAGLLLVLGACGGGGSGGGEPGPGPAPGTSVQRYDFQPEGGALEPGFVAVTPADLYSAERGFGFRVAPTVASSGAQHTWSVFGRTVTVEEAMPPSVLSAATIDCVGGSGAGGGRTARPQMAPFAFRADVEPGAYTVTLWLGDVTSPLYQVRATVNGVVADVSRMDVNSWRGNFDQSIYGGAVPVVVHVDALDGLLDVEVGSHPDGASPLTWTYEQDEDPNNPPSTKTATLVPAFRGCALQALTLHPLAEPPLRQEDGLLVRGAAPAEAGLAAALGAFNAGEVDAALSAFRALSDPETQGAGLFWTAGHPALLEVEPEILAEADGLLAPLATRDHAAADLLLQVRLAADAERSRRLYGYAASGSPATDNLGRSCALVETFPPGHPYHVKGQILWLRNRGGLDPRRVTVSWERAQWLARELEAAWGAVNPYVHLYATDEWSNAGRPWRVIDWAAIAGPGPDWARSLMSNMNGWLDLFEWWAIHRQSPEGDIGGGWTDDVEIVPAFGLMAYVLEGASDISRDAVIRFADGLWASDIIDRDRGYQAQYADVEHTAEPTGNILHLYPLVRFGDPEGIERILKSAKTFRDLFLVPSGATHKHFAGNHLSATQIATNPDHRADIPLCGRATNPFPFLVWYSGNPGLEGPLTDWIGSWVDDAARTDARKPVGVFPQTVWTPSDGIGYPGLDDWWSANATYGQYSAFPGYQYYLYNLSAWSYLRTGEERFRLPLDRLQEYALAWAAAGRPSLGPAPPVGQEAIWCGGKLQTAAQGALTNAAIGSGLTDWNAYISRFGDTYGRFLLDPTDATPIDDLAALSEELYAKWPYRTTEGVMTDRLLVVGWADVISYFIGAEVFSVFFGMPVHAATWENSTRLFAAAVTRATPQALDATTYLFADEGREISVRLWQLEVGASYVLEAGPAAGLALDPDVVALSVPFTYEHLGDAVAFTLPGRTTYALRIRQTSPPPPASPLLADLAVAPRDVTFQEGDPPQLTIRVHNVGAADATGGRVTVYEGLDATGTLIGSVDLGAIAAPTDLVPKWRTATLPYAPAHMPVAVTVVVEPTAEITHANNQATAWLGAAAPDLPPPMLVALDPWAAAAGSQVAVLGRGLEDGAIALSSESLTAHFMLDVHDPEHATLTVASGAPPGAYVLSVENPDGKRSNLLPLTVTP